MVSGYIRNKIFPGLFAYDRNANINVIDTEQNGFTYFQGIPPMYSSRTGTKVNRADINGIGRAISQSKIFNQFGGYYTFDKEVSNIINGYPQGAVLYYKDNDIGKVRLVRSLIENNRKDFVENPGYIDNINWSFVDTITPVSFRPRIFTNTVLASPTITLNGAPITVQQDCLVIIQTGTDEAAETPADYDDLETISDDYDGDVPQFSDADTARVFMYAQVKRKGEEIYHDASCLGCILPIGEAYDMVAESLSPTLMSKSSFTSFYASSPVQIYLHAGDSLRATSTSAPPNTITFQAKVVTLTA